LTLDIQSRLLRVLQSKEFERVGGGREILTSDFRFIAATNKNLEQEVLAGRFRQDLYYRINVYPLHVAPLRERREDIPLLADHFLAQANIKQNKQCAKLPANVVQLLMRYEWPGNIRELENVILRGVIGGNGRHFDLPQLKALQPITNQPQPLQTLAENERRHILEVLRKTGGKIHGPAGAAQLLGINAYTLTSRMKKLGITKAMGGAKGDL
jgi:transcriptional regulator with GAF, ATPase, and Fis domain